MKQDTFYLFYFILFYFSENGTETQRASVGNLIWGIGMTSHLYQRPSSYAFFTLKYAFAFMSMIPSQE